MGGLFKGCLLGTVLLLGLLVACCSSDLNTFENGDEAIIMRRLVSCEDLDYDNPSDNYSPSRYVKYGHTMSGGEDFCLEQEYTATATIAPISIFAVFVVMGVCFLIGLMGRCCSEWCQCRPDYDGSAFDKDRICNFAAFYLLCLLVLVLDQLVYIGSTGIDKGLNTVETEVKDISDTFKDILDEGTRLIDLGNRLEGHFIAAQISCNATVALSSMEETVSDYEEASLEFYQNTEPVDKELEDVIDYFEDYGTLYRIIGLYLVWALSLLDVLLFILAKCCGSYLGLKLSVVLGILVYALYTALILVWSSIISIFGDFCMDPSRSGVVASPDDESVQDLAVYYSTCVGNSSLTIELSNARIDANSLNSSIASLLALPDDPGSNCPGDANVLKMQETLDDIYQQLDVGDMLVDCEPIQDQWFQALNQGLCKQFYEGVFSIWISQLLTSFFLFLLLVTATITYQYHDMLSESAVAPLDSAAKGGSGSSRKVAPGGAGWEGDPDSYDDYDQDQDQGHHQGRPPHPHQRQPNHTLDGEDIYFNEQGSRSSGSSEA